jgi:Carboxypeptidase regulatory-like domain
MVRSTQVKLEPSISSFLCKFCRFTACYFHSHFGGIAQQFRIYMKSVAQFVSSYRGMFLAAIIAMSMVSVSFLDGAKAQKSEVPAAVHTVTVVNTTGTAGNEVFIDVELESAGDEVAGGFTLRFDPTKLSITTNSGSSNPDVTRGTGLPAGSGFTVNSGFTPVGRIGVLFDSSDPFAASPPNRQCVRFRFVIAAGAAAGPTTLELVGNPPGPVGRSFSDANANDINMTWVNGTLTIQAAAPPVTVSGRVTVPGGAGLRNALVTLTDTNNVRRTATTSTFGYYTFANVPAGPTYTAAVVSRRYAFTPRTQAITADLVNFDFAGN